MQKVITVEDGTPQVVTIPESIRGYITQIQIDVTGGGNVKIETKTAGMDNYIEQAAANNQESLMLNMINIESLRFTVTGTPDQISVSAR